MEWLRLKEYGMKNNHIKKLMLIFQDFEELFYEENFKLFNDELKHQLDESMKIDMKERLNLYERNRVRIISANDKEYPKKLKEIKDYPVFLYLKGKKLKDYDKIKIDKNWQIWVYSQEVKLEIEKKFEKNYENTENLPEIIVDKNKIYFRKL